LFVLSPKRKTLREIIARLWKEATAAMTALVYFYT
jgi:hypothetical protein